jgi:uncharacterized protein YjbJ (UPF0337 family)
MNRRSPIENSATTRSNRGEGMNKDQVKGTLKDRAGKVQEPPAG